MKMAYEVEMEIDPEELSKIVLKACKAERERCAEIADRTLVPDSGSETAREIARKIRALNWVTVRCTSPACRGRRKGGEGFETTVEEGYEQGAMCNECFSR